MSRDRRRRIVAWALAVAGAFALGALLSWILLSFASVNGAGSGEGQVARPAGDFTINGDLVEPGSPGVFEPLDLTITNPYDEALLVTRLTVSVSAVDAPNSTADLPCSTEDFAVRQFAATPLRVDAGESHTLSDLGVAKEDWPRVGMTDADTNQDGCKGASLSLAFTATGRVDK